MAEEELRRKFKVHYGWIIVIGGFVAAAIASAMRQAFGVFLGPLVSSFGWGYGATSLALAIYWVTFGVASILLGRFSDRYGARKIMLLGAAFFIASMLLTSQTKTIWELYIYYGVLLGIAMASFVAPLHITIVAWFHKGLGLALGVVQASSALGPMLMLPLVNAMITRLSWSHAFLYTGIAGGVLVLGGALLVFSHPRDLGLRAFGEVEDSSNPAQVKEKVKARSTGEDLQAQRAALSSWPFMAMVITHFLGCVSHALPLAYAVVIVMQSGHSSATGAAVLALASGISVVSRFGSSVLADVLGAKRLLVLALGLQSLGIMMLFIAQTAPMFYLFAVIFGLGYGGEMVVYPILNRQFFGNIATGSIYGYELLGAGLGMALGSYLGGALFDLYGNNIPSIWVAVLTGFAGAIVTMFMGRPLVNSLKNKIQLAGASGINQ